MDFFAAYVIPAAVLLLGKQKKAFTLFPEDPRHPERHRYEPVSGSVELLLPAKSKSKGRDRSVRSRRALFDPQPAS